MTENTNSEASVLDDDIEITVGTGAVFHQDGMYDEEVRHNATRHYSTDKMQQRQYATETKCNTNLIGQFY